MTHDSRLPAKLKWREYYWRVHGVWGQPAQRGLAGAGAGLVLDELIHGPFTLTPVNHEFWGLVLLIAGCAAITRKPKGKDLS